MNSKAILLISCLVLAAACSKKNDSNTTAAPPVPNNANQYMGGQCSSPAPGTGPCASVSNRPSRGGVVAIDADQFMYEIPYLYEVVRNWSDSRIHKAELRMDEEGNYRLHLSTIDQFGNLTIEYRVGVAQPQDRNHLLLPNVGRIAPLRLADGTLCADVDLMPLPPRSFSTAFTVCDPNSAPTQYENGNGYPQTRY